MRLKVKEPVKSRLFEFIGDAKPKEVAEEIRHTTLKIRPKKAKKGGSIGICTQLGTEPQSYARHVSVTSPCRSATSLSFRKEREVLAKPKQGEVKDKALRLR
jgi:hypothetical protein